MIPMKPFDQAWQLLKSYSPFSHLRPGTEGYFPRAHRDLSDKMPPPRGGRFYQRASRPTPPAENHAAQTNQMPADSEDYMDEFKQRYSE